MTQVSGRVFVTFPHAGGMGSGFLKLKPHLPPGTGFAFLDYPGKGLRKAEPLPERVQDLAASLLGELRPLFEGRRKRVVFFGYSLGGLVAYEAARLLAGEGMEPEMIVTASMVPPQLQSRGRSRYHLLEEGPFLEVLEKVMGFPGALLGEPAFRNFFLPRLRREVEVAEKYRWQPGPRPSCPLLSLYGKEDRVVFNQGGTPEDWRNDLGLWGELTDGGFSLHFMEGGHFFLLEDPEPGMEVIRRGLEEGLVPRGTP